MKIRNYFICTSLALFLLITPSLAHRYSYDPVPVVSPWAQEELQRAWEIGFGINTHDPEILFNLRHEYSEPITRREFCVLAMQYMAIQYHSTTIVELSYDALTRKDGAPPKDVFSDGNRTENIAYYLGIVEGRGDGTFDPDGLVTRQEAAVILARVYCAIGGALPEEAKAVPFCDRDKIAEWARESVEALHAWQVLQGLPDGSFDPQGAYTIEQSVITFLRLYENTLVSRKNGNVTQRFNYEDSLRWRTNMGNWSPTLVVEGKLATMVECNIIRAPHSSVFWSFVYRGGGTRVFDLGICMNAFEYPDLENPRFSEDGNTFFCTVTLKEDTVSSYGLKHKKGVYHITTDVNTGRSTSQWEELKADAGS